MESEKKEKKPINLRALKGGSYSLALCAAVLVVVILINLFVGALPSTKTKLDASAVGLFTLSEETKKLAASVTEPVTFYLVAPRGQEDAAISELLARYADLNENIKTETVDPDTNPAFVSQYTTSTLASNSVIAVSALRSYVIPYDSIYYTSYDNLTDEDLYNYYYYGITPEGTPYFSGEPELTSALDYVTAAAIPTIYTLSGQDEDALSDAMRAYFTTDNMLTASLSLLGESGIPADCSAILVNNPKSDLSAYEAERLTAYLAGGGNVILVTDFRYCTAAKMPNLLSVARTMGMDVEEGIVVETNRNSYNTYPTYLLPTIGSAGPGASLAADLHALLPNAHGSAVSGDAAAWIRTTTASFIKAAGADIQTYEKEEGDTEGPCAVAAYAEKDGGKMVWFATPSVVSDQWDYYVNGGNSTVFMGGVSWMCEKSASVSVIAKQMQVQSLVVPEGSAAMWSLLLTVLVPLAVLVGGFVLWFRRTRR
jgi:ABC-2 type transport system permease protein